VPIVPAASLFDLAVGRADTRPDAAAGYAACEAAQDGALPAGNVGAGVGATAGKLLGFERATKTGLGNASIAAGALIVGALAAVNPVGEIVDPEQGRIVAGVRDPEGGGFIPAARLMQAMAGTQFRDVARGRENTTLVVVATNARLDKAQATRVAMMAHDGIARVIRPSHHPFDGDIVFTLATGEVTGDPGVVGALAAEATAAAILDAVRHARPLHGVPVG
jgi:L-aminopeptidase/D-esterase-like protein